MSRMHHRTLLTVLAAASLGLTAVSCGPSQEQLDRIAELEQAAAQKDSLLVEMADLGRFISNVNAELFPSVLGNGLDCLAKVITAVGDEGKLKSFSISFQPAFLVRPPSRLFKEL